MMRITAITCTGDRPIPFALCERWMRRQTRQVDQWIVVDDGQQRTDPTMGQVYVRREPEPNDPPHTLARNLKAAMPYVQGDAVLFIEDDDYYTPQYVANMCRLLDVGDVVGQMNPPIYRLRRQQWRIAPKVSRVMLFRTGITRAAFPCLEKVCEKDHYSVDYRLWTRWSWSKVVYDRDPVQWSVGIKGLPGRKGQTGVWHRSKGDFQEDPSGEVLMQLLGPDFPYYEPYMGEEARHAG